MTYHVVAVDRGERVLEAHHFICACIRLVRRASAEQVIVIILDCSHLVVFRCELVCIVSEKCALASSKIERGRTVIVEVYIAVAACLSGA